MPPIEMNANANITKLVEKDTLSFAYADVCKNFYNKIKEPHPHSYKIILSDRCFYFMYLFNSAEGDFNYRFKEDFYTADYFLANTTKEIAKCYEEKCFIPLIYIIDDVLDHGRTMNGFIEELVDKIYNLLKKNDNALKFREIKDEIIYHLRIKVIARKRPIHIYKYRFNNNLTAELTYGNGSPSKFYELSFYISKAVNQYVFPDKSYIPVVRISPKEQDTINYIFNKLNNSKMIPAPSNATHLDKFWIYVADNNILYGIRCLTSEATEEKVFIPFVLFSSINKNFDSVYEAETFVASLCQQMLKDLFKDEEEYVVILNYTNDNSNKEEGISRNAVEAGPILEGNKTGPTALLNMIYDNEHHIHLQEIGEEYTSNMFKPPHLKFSEIIGNIDDIVRLYGLIDSGILELKIVKDTTNNNYFYEVAASKLALYYLPASFVKHLSTLSFLERRSQYYLNTFIGYIRRWARFRGWPKKETDDVISFVIALKDAGLDVEDWHDVTPIAGMFTRDELMDKEGWSVKALHIQLAKNKSTEDTLELIDCLKGADKKEDGRI